MFCSNHLCNVVISHSGDVSDVIEENGRPINAMNFDFGESYAFEVNCASGHRTRLASPRDVKIVRGPAALGDPGPLLTLKRR